MKTRDAIAEFGSVKSLAQVLGVTVQAIYRWSDKVPKLRQFQIELASQGRLKADLPACEPSTPAGVRADHPDLIRDLVAKVAQSEQAGQPSGRPLPSSTAAAE